MAYIGEGMLGADLGGLANLGGGGGAGLFFPYEE